MRRRKAFPVHSRRSIIMSLETRTDRSMGPKASIKPSIKPSMRTTPPAFASDDARWQAVKRRDRAADGAFYYSVLTTGVYCRPSCASRLARRENVRFHATPAAAERAGFRPCKRCRPNEPALAERQAKAIAQACRLIE